MAETKANKPTKKKDQGKPPEPKTVAEAKKRERQPGYWQMTDDEVLSLLAGLLKSNGLPATFDPILNVLSLDNPIPDGATLIWGSTDENLEFAVEFDAVASETSSLELVGISLVVLVLILRRRSTK